MNKEKRLIDFETFSKRCKFKDHSIVKGCKVYDEQCNEKCSWWLQLEEAKSPVICKPIDNNEILYNHAVSIYELAERINKLETTLLVNESRSVGC